LTLLHPECIPSTPIDIKAQRLDASHRYVC
jgi:hypothetical protein